MEKNTENKQFLTLSQFLKLKGIIQTGGQAKYFILENEIFVNKIKETRRGRKLYKGDIVLINNIDYTVDD